MGSGGGRGGCVDACLRTLITILNVLLLLIGLGILAIGGVAVFKPELYSAGLNIFNSVAPYVPGIDQDNAVLFATDLAGSLRPFGVAFMVLGGILTGISFVGCCGACYNIRCFLIAYAVLLGVMILAVIALVVAYFGFRDELSEKVRGELTGVVQERYVGHEVYDKRPGHHELTKDEAVSVVINLVNRKFSCCGINNYTDFDGAVNWDRSADIVVNGFPTKIQHLTTPLSCCHHHGNFTDATPINPAICAHFPLLKEQNYFYQGCYDKLYEALEDPTFYMVIGVIIFFLFLVMLFVCTVYLARSTRGNKK